MIPFVFAFLAGDLLLQQQQQLPSWWYILVSILLGIILWSFVRKYTYYFCLFFAVMLGIAWSEWYAARLLAWSPPNNIIGEQVSVEGYVASLPVVTNDSTSFIFQLDKMDFQDKITSPKQLIRLMWHQTSRHLRVGDKLALQVVLKPIHGLHNPGGFDFEAWALQRGLRATGVVVNGQNVVVSHHWLFHPIDQFRQSLQERVHAYLPDSESSAWLIALITGERVGITQAQWQVLRRTGTNHLMAIGGLHIGMLAAIVQILFSKCWRRLSNVSLHIPAQEAGACAALLMALFYSALAGFSIPTQRACLMLTLFVFVFCTRQKVNAWYVWSAAMLAVLCLNPLSVLTDSFWLSFGTIALIIYGMSGRLSPQGLWWKWGRVQWVIGVGLIPFSMLFFQECSIISIVANSIAIPWLEFLILPFCLLSSVFLFIVPPIGHLLLIVADKSMSLLWMLLSWFAEWPSAVWMHAIPNWFVLTTTLLGCVCFLLPAGFPGRYLGLIWMMPLFLYSPATPLKGDVWLTLLDVGQGLSVVVQTHTHTLVFDTGPKLNDAMDMGENVVLPFLRQSSTKQIDMLVISHGDNDHIRGAKAILQSMPVLAIKTSVPERLHTYSSSYCMAGESWQWDGVQFEFIYPYADTLHLGNDSSCVLRIDNGKHSVVLPGDIEKLAEKNMLERSTRLLPTTILVAPHHGSKTSATSEFLTAMHPQYVLYATGFRNRYHFPHESVVAEYTLLGSKQLDTSQMGAIQLKLEKRSLMVEVEGHRIKHQRYWY